MSLAPETVSYSLGRNWPLLLIASFFALVSFDAGAQEQASLNSAAVRTLGPVEYIEVNTPGSIDNPKQLIIFVHGTPGSSTTFSRYLNDPIMGENFHMISVTRPGWLHDDDVKLPSLIVQAEALEPFLHMDNSGKGAILMAHSYGGPVIARTAMDYSELVAGLVFVATTGDPELSGPRWYNRFAEILPEFVLGAGLKGANAEIMPLKPQLEELLTD